MGGIPTITLPTSPSVRIPLRIRSVALWLESATLTLFERPVRRIMLISTEIRSPLSPSTRAEGSSMTTRAGGWPDRLSLILSRRSKDSAREVAAGAERKSSG